MNRFSTALTRYIQNARSVEIAFTGRGGAYAVSLVTNFDMQSIAVDTRVNRHATNPESTCAAGYAHRDLSAIGNQNFVEHH